MKFNIEDFRNELKNKLTPLLYFTDDSEFKKELTDYLNRLNDENIIVSSTVRKSKLSRKLKKQYKKNHTLCLDVFVTFPACETLVMMIDTEVENG